MSIKTAQELKQKYLNFFQSKGHVLIHSAPLIPANDASVLFNTAGMQPLVPFLLGEKHPLGKRLVNVQKCLRTVDFENIGDDTHHTFFLMLGNWSIGDYFKKEAINWSFEFLTSKEGLSLPFKKLAFTVYEGGKGVPRDEESYALWRSLGVPEARIVFLGKDNFWIAGESGPCGPSTEMFYWKGEKEAPAKFNPEDNNWVEIWNDVFMAYNKQADGLVLPLKQKNVDTGMGLERTLAVLSGKKSAYETDLFQPMINKLEKISGKKYAVEKDSPERKAMRIIADHLRASVFILGEDNFVTPSNVDRGYILRRLIRRSVRYGKLLGLKKSFMALIAKEVIQIYGNSFPELEKNHDRIYIELEKEEEKFEKTLETGLKELEKMAAGGDIDGKGAFLLFQSYGFPLEMTEELASEKGIKVDTKSFLAEFEKHQQLSRIGAEKKFKGGLSDSSAETTKLHTVTHLLNEALRKILKEDIKQRGSNITPERLRFDFNFDRKLTDDELKKIEEEVNKRIKEKLEVVREEMPAEQALKSGAHGEFGAKYPAKVSVYTIGKSSNPSAERKEPKESYSKEICMGPHVKNTGKLGKFRILKEESSAAGIRRIKAVLE